MNEELERKVEGDADRVEAMRAAMEGMSFAGCVFDGPGSSNVLPAMVEVTNAQALLAAELMAGAGPGGVPRSLSVELEMGGEELSFCGVIFERKGSTEGGLVGVGVTPNQVALAGAYLGEVVSRSLNDAWTRQQMDQARELARRQREANEVARIMGSLGATKVQ